MQVCLCQKSGLLHICFIGTVSYSLNIDLFWLLRDLHLFTGYICHIYIYFQGIKTGKSERLTYFCYCPWLYLAYIINQSYSIEVIRIYCLYVPRKKLSKTTVTLVRIIYPLIAYHTADSRRMDKFHRMGLKIPVLVPYGDN